LSEIHEKFKCSKVTFPFQNKEFQNEIIKTNNNKINKIDIVINNNNNKEEEEAIATIDSNDSPIAIATKNIPLKFKNKLEEVIQNILEAVDENAVGWSNLFDSSGVIGKKRENENSSVIYVRGDSIVPFNVADVFKILVAFEKLNELEPNREITEILTYYSTCTSVQYLKYKPVLFLF
jgi:hypothetical protein